MKKIILIIELILIVGLSVIAFSPKSSKETKEPKAPTQIEKKLQEKTDIIDFYTNIIINGTLNGEVMDFEKIPVDLKKWMVDAYFRKYPDKAKTGTLKQFPKIKDLYVNDYGKTEDTKIMYIPESDYIEKYKELFGSSDIEKIRNDHYYYEDYSIFFLTIEPFSEYDLNDSRYYYKFDEDDHNYYVYLSTAYVYSDKAFKTTADYFSDNTFIKCKEGTTCQEIKDFNINENNYEEFNQFKVTYKKDGNEFYLKQIEKLIN